jgi:hypothetical protein
MPAAEQPPAETTAKESFSGPSSIIEAAHQASDLKFGTRPGGWSRWVVEALSEKLQAENPELFATLKALATVNTNAETAELLAKIEALLDDDPSARAELAKFIRARRRKAAAAA